MEKEQKSNKEEYKYLKPLILGSIIIVIIFWLINMVSLGYMNSTERGTLGDMFGAVNAIFSGLAFAGIIISLYMQRIDLKNQQKQIELNHKEVKQTNREFKIQNNTLSIQRFENQYYKMIDLHKLNVNEISIPFFDSLDGSNSSRDNKKIEQHSSANILREVKGKKGFVDMIKELEFCILDTKSVMSNKELNIKDSILFDFAYRIFFFGVHSDFSTSDKIPEDIQKQIKRFIANKQKKYKDNLISGATQEINTRYVPFQGHESRLAHYYRHLFQTVKYVVQQEENGIIEYKEIRQYLRVLRAQLSNAEQLMLYYNYICGFGKNWDRLGKKYEFLTKYRMIHNIPVDRVKHVENPRDHFKVFIDSMNDDKDPLFEWGDYIK
tara:strand:- start:164847 stop:165986 length:1140 start_codon:yes stop_codon:yes gene_type:complete